MAKQLTERQIIDRNKRLLLDYTRFATVPKRYNKSTIQGNVFTLTRLKDGHVITRFDINTFKPL